jgi:hypothetical protein
MGFNSVFKELSTVIKETQLKSKRPDIRGDIVDMKLKTRIGFWGVRTLREYGEIKASRKRNDKRMR